MERSTLERSTFTVDRLSTAAVAYRFLHAHIDV